MKKTEIVLPVNCELLKEENAKTICGGIDIFTICATVTVTAWQYGYPAAGRYARTFWPKKIPTWAKITLMAAFPDPIGWSQFMQGYNGKA